MTLDPRTDANLTQETIDRVEDLCTIFERDWRRGARPVIEEPLAGCSGLEREVLLRELLAVDLEYCLRAGERPALSQYIARFPRDRPLVELVFREAAEAANGSGANNALNAIGADLPYTFGDYQLLEEVARGGMGVIYKARQLSLDRIVAVKMILTGQLASTLEVTRFRLEAQAVAQLDHPNIVPIIEVGATDGQHFFSMGFVDGVSLAERIAAAPLAPRVAAELLHCLAKALQYAHERGVVHRDIKPANILLDVEGRPRITDFGLAKCARDRGSLTATGQPVGTPAFMPPEQATGKAESVGPTSDVYSLGAVLYAAVTGRPPFQGASGLDVLKLVLERDPVAPRHLDPTLPRDLETITLKCLEKNPAKRYPSAQLLADELQRFLSGEPIRARAIGSVERTNRWCRRNPATAATAGLAALLLVAVTVTSTVAAIRISALRDEAVEQKQAASENFVRAESERERTETERNRAERNLQYARQVIQRLAESYGLLGDRQERFDERLQWYDKAHSLLADLAHDSPSSLEFQTELAESFGRLGMLHARAGKNAEAMSAFDQAVEVLDRLCQQHPDRPQYQSQLAKACNFLGKQYETDNQCEKASARYRQACRFQETLLSSHPPGTIEDRRDLAFYYINLGAAQHNIDRFAESQASYEQAQRCLEPLAAQFPSEAEVQAMLALLYRDMGIRHKSIDAVLWLGRARAILETVIAAHPDESRYRAELAWIITELAKRETRPDRAVFCQRQAHDLWERLAKECPSDPDVQRNAVWSLRDDARFLGLAGYHREARGVLKLTLDKMAQVAPPGAAEKHADFEVHILSLMARSELRFGDAGEYRRYCQAILDRCHTRNCYAHDALRVCILLGDAVTDWDRLVEVAKDATRLGSRTLRKKVNVGGALYRAGRYEEAIDVLNGVDRLNRLALFAHAGTAEIVRADNARAAVLLSLAHFRLGRPDDAVDWLQKARQWIDSEGSSYANSAIDSADQASPTPAAGDVESADVTTGASTDESSNATVAYVNEPSIPLGLEDRMLLADIVFELQVLLNEADLLVSACRP